jgi:hypothetical protein
MNCSDKGCSKRFYDQKSSDLKAKAMALIKEDNESGAEKPKEEEK